MSKLWDTLVLRPKMFSSSPWPRLEIPCKLRRFATGLPWLGWSRFMVASLRFNAPVVETMQDSLLLSSAFRNEYWEAAPDTSRCTLWRAVFSRFLRGVEPSEFPLLFSCPGGEAVAWEKGDEGVLLPESGVALKVRFKGLLGDTRARASGRDDGDAGLADLEERSDNLTLGRSGVNIDD